MPKYAVFFSYTSDAMQSMIANPQDREAVARSVVEAIGGSLESFYWMFGEWDGFAVAEIDDAVSAGAVSVAVSSGGGLASVQTHRLLDSDERVAVLQKAGEAVGGYTPPS